MSEHFDQADARSSNPAWRFLQLVGLAIAVSVLFFACLMWGAGPALPPEDEFGVGVGDQAPPIRAAGWVNGSPPDSLHGKVVVVDFWATWCGPCWELAPELVEIHERLADPDLVFIGLTAEGPEALSEIKGFVSKNGIEWPNGYGAVESVNAFDVHFWPSLWVIDRNGTVVWNMSTSASPEKAIREALAAPVRPPEKG